MQKVFVYGTLKRGGRLHEHLDGTFLGPAVAPGWVLHKLDWYPCVTRGAGTVHGELYAVRSLETLDQIEGYPDLFNRTRARVLLGEVEHEAWIYYRHSCDAPIIESGLWDAEAGHES